MKNIEKERLANIADNNYRKLFGALMRLRRVEKQLTHDILAINSGTSRPTLSKMESAKVRVKDLTLEKVANALDISNKEIQLLRDFANVYNPDDGIRIMLSLEFISAIGNIRVAEIFENAAYIGSKTPDTNQKEEMFGRTALAIAIVSHHERIPQCTPSWN